jgi:hypothetical protein
LPQSYEGDENPARAQQEPKVLAFDNVVPPQPASGHINSTSTATDPRPNHQTQLEPALEQPKNIQEEPYVSTEGDQQMYSNPQNGENSNNWEDGHLNDYGDGGAEHETHGTGIKEDG